MGGSSSKSPPPQLSPIITYRIPQPSPVVKRPAPQPSPVTTLPPPKPSYIIPTSQPPKPAPIKQITANRIVYHDANNYIIPNTNIPATDERIFEDSLGRKMDKFNLRVCAKYLSKKGCNAKYCYRFHVCQFWIKGGCRRSDCPFDHHFDSNHNRPMLTLILWRKFGDQDLIEKLGRNLYAGKGLRDETSNYICMNYILKQCKGGDTCDGIHSNSPYSWEMYVENKWVPFNKRQNEEIERAYCNPANTSFLLPLKSATSKRQINSKESNPLTNCKVISIHFENMSMKADNSFWRVRRLSTQSDMAAFKSVATRWLWYWQDEHGKWNFFTNAIVNDFGVIPFSDHIEIQFLKRVKEFSYYLFGSEHTIQFEFMSRTNRFGSKENIRRRPMMVPEQTTFNDKTTFTSLWSNANSITRFVRQDVSKDSPEFYFIKNMINQTLFVIEIYIERIENTHLWQFYQNNKDKMKRNYKNDMQLLNEQYLFHGTSKSVVDKICSDNLDWRLYGTSVGNIYGQGTYFSSSAEYSQHYALEAEDGYKYMFVALVLIGKATIGDKHMTLPTIDKSTQMRFDATVDSVNPKIFVKYNLDDYYPAYLVKFKK